MRYTAHVDTFARDNLPPKVLWPELLFELPELQYPMRLNCATELLDKPVTRGGAAAGPAYMFDPTRSKLRYRIDRGDCLGVVWLAMGSVAMVEMAASAMICLPARNSW